MDAGTVRARPREPHRGGAIDDDQHGAEFTFSASATPTIPARVVVQIEPVTVDRGTAATMLGMSLDSFERYVQPDLRIVRRGRLRLVPVAEIKRWADDKAESLFR